MGALVHAAGTAVSHRQQSHRTRTVPFHLQWRRHIRHPVARSMTPCRAVPRSERHLTRRGLDCEADHFQQIIFSRSFSYAISMPRSFPLSRFQTPPCP